MKDAIWGFVGVIAGSLITSIFSYLNNKNEYKKWLIDHRTELLRSRKTELKGLFERANLQLIDMLRKDDFSMSVETYAEFEFLFPKNVLEAFEQMEQELAGPNINAEKRKFHLYAINRQMKNAIAKIDKEIEALC